MDELSLMLLVIGWVGVIGLLGTGIAAGSDEGKPTKECVNDR